MSELTKYKARFHAQEYYRIEEADAKIAKLEAELKEAKELLTDARTGISYLSGISETAENLLNRIKEFLKG